MRQEGVDIPTTRRPSIDGSGFGSRTAEIDCPYDEDVDWHEVAAGLWPELKAKQLIMHAALCDHCGPLLVLLLPWAPTPPLRKKNCWRNRGTVTAHICPATCAASAITLADPWLVPAIAVMVTLAYWVSYGRRHDASLRADPSSTPKEISR
jgi:hypothetical protein